MAGTLAQLVGKRSSRAAGLIAYLRALVKWADEERPPHLKGRRIADLYVMPEVLKQEGRGDHERNRLRAHSHTEEQAGRFGPEDDRRTRVRWDRELRQIRRAVAIIGLPGSGKTLLGHMTARDLAVRGLVDLEAQRKGIDDVAIPVWVRLADVAEKDLATAVRDRIRFLLEGSCLGEEDGAALTHVVEDVPRRVATNQVWLFLDALDEVPEPGRLRAKLRSLANAQCRIIVTSRPYGYDPGCLSFGVDVEYELAPFMPRARRQFIQNWFRTDEAKRTRVLELAQANPQFGDMTRNPLLLTLTCATAENHELSPQETRRVDLYRYVVRDMARGAWKDQAKADDQQISLLVRLLRSTAWELFRPNPARTAFSDDEWIDALLAVGRDLLLSWPPDKVFAQLKMAGFIVSPAVGQSMFVHRSFLEFLAAEYVAQQKETDPIELIKPFLWQPDKDGILRWQPAAAEMICLLAGCLKDAAPLIRLLVQSDEEHCDLFRTMLLLAGLALREAAPSQRVVHLAESAVSELGRLMLQPPLGMWSSDVVPALCHRFGKALFLKWADNEALQLAAARGLEALGAVDALCHLLGASRFFNTRHHVAEALNRLGDESAVWALTRASRRDAAPLVRRTAIYALQAIGTPSAANALLDILRDILRSGREIGELLEVTSALRKLANEQDASLLLEAMRCVGNAHVRLEAMLCDVNAHVRHTAALVLADIPSEKAVDALVLRLQDEERRTRWPAARALVQISSPRAMDALVACLRDGRSPELRWAVTDAFPHVVTSDSKAVDLLIERLRQDTDPRVRCSAIRALQTSGSPKAMAAITEALLDADASQSAAMALGKMPCEEAIQALGKCLLSNASSASRHQAAWALQSIRSEKAVDVLIESINRDRDRKVRSSAIVALGSIGGQKAVHFLLSQLKQAPEPAMRCAAAFALGVAGGATVVDPLSERLGNDEEAVVRKAAAEALGKIGNEEAVEWLLDRLCQEQQLDVRQTIVKALAKSGSEHAMTVLLNQLRKQTVQGNEFAVGLRRISIKTGRFVSLTANS